MKKRSKALQKTTGDAGQDNPDNKHNLSKTELAKYNAFKNADDIHSIITAYHKLDKETIKVFKNPVIESIHFAMLEDDGLMTVLTKALYPLREDLRQELDIKTRSELALLDAGIMAYGRHLYFTKYIGLYLSKGMSNEKSLILERLQRLSDNTMNQYIRAIETIKNMKLTSIRVNISNSQVNVSNNQQINNALIQDARTDLNPNNFGKLETDSVGK